jgi:hypothetical protein
MYYFDKTFQILFSEDENLLVWEGSLQQGLCHGWRESQKPDLSAWH